jgi:tRNA 5-methylaminomethyl-2-thiouridine biosynthesis bifunctional protein
LFGEAINGFEQLRHSNHPQWQDNSPHHVDAWFLDGFAPAKNPSMWNSTLYSLLADLSHSGTTLATFTAVGAVRRGLAEQGFVMEKATGYGKKREMLLGCFDPSLRQSPVMIPRPKKDIKVPWYVNQDTINLPNTIKSDKALHIAIIGGGLAGTGTANALAKRGCKVTLLERENALAQGASGNPQGMLYTKLSARMSKLNQFTLSSYLFALRYYQQWQQTYDINNLQKDFCGVLQLASSEKDKNILSQLKTAFATHPQLVQFLNPEQASEIAGVTIDQPSCWFPQAGWISPTKVCETLTNHDLITKQFQQHITDIVRKDHQWLLLDEQQQSILSADIVVIANSSDAKRFSVTKHLPLKSIRGQISLLPANTESAKLNTVICHEGYITPAIHGRHSLGATYSLGDSDTDIRTADHQTNLDNLQQALPSLLSDENYSGEASSLDGRASLRCSTLDYLPLVGPVHNHQQFITDYDKLRKNALMDSPQAGTYLPGLYLNVGHGSRGLTSTPLCSELLASMICSEPPPLPRVLTQALNPARFVIRNLIRNKC